MKPSWYELCEKGRLLFKMCICKLRSYKGRRIIMYMCISLHTGSHRPRVSVLCQLRSDDYRSVPLTVGGEEKMCSVLLRQPFNLVNFLFDLQTLQIVKVGLVALERAVDIVLPGVAGLPQLFGLSFRLTEIRTPLNELKPEKFEFSHKLTEIKPRAFKVSHV